MDKEDSDEDLDLEEADNFSESYLGDPNAYYHSVLKNPLPENVEDYFIKKHKIETKEQYADFLQSAVFIREFSKYDYLLFFEQILGNIVVDFHKLFVKQVYGHRSVTLAPRGVGKSHFFSVGLPIWLAYYGKAKKIMIISETDDQAKRILEDIKKNIQENPMLKDQLWVKPSSKESTWNKGSIKTKGGIEIQAKSFTSKLRGFHPHALILDDVLSDQNSLTKTQREQVFNYYAQTVRPMATKKAMIQLVGTAQHQDDLLHRLGDSEKIGFLKLQAYDEETKESIWPEQLPVDELEDYKKTYGIISFEKEFQNNPMSDNLSLFPMHVLEECLDENLSYSSGYNGAQKVFTGADFSMSGVKEGDFTVVTSCRRSEDGILSILNYDRYRDNPENKEMFVDKQIETVADHCQRYNTTLGYLESNAFQRIYSEFFKKKTNLPLRGNNVTNAGKNSLLNGIPGIRVLMENGKIKFPYKTDLDKIKTEEIIREFNGLVITDKGKINNQRGHDDIVMSMFHMIQAAKEVSEMYMFRSSNDIMKSSRAHNVLGKRLKGRRRI